MFQNCKSDSDCEFTHKEKAVHKILERGVAYPILTLFPTHIVQDSFLCIYHILLVGPLELHASKVSSHTLSLWQCLPTKELIGHPVAYDQCSMSIITLRACAGVK